MAAGAHPVRVAVEALADRPERTFSYLLPDDLGSPQPGSLLLVPYGRRLALGYLLPGEPDPGPAELKPVEAVVSEPMLPPDLLALAPDLAAYYRAPLGVTIAAMLPPGLESRLERRWRIKRPAELPADAADAVDAAAAGGDGLVSDAAMRRRLTSRELERLRRAGSIVAVWSLRGAELGPRRVRVVRRLPGDGALPRRAPVQRALLEALGEGESTLPELAAQLEADAAALLAPARRLAAAGHVDLGWRVVERDPLAHRVPSAPLRHALATEQAAALDAIGRLVAGGELVLEGVAASGKSDVYLAAAQEALASGRGVILLEPELSMVPQLADRAVASLGERPAVLHSGLSAGERHDEWWRILRGEARVVIGTRSAVFAPVPALGLIVVDEEHDGGYKSDRTPRYDARWVARRRAILAGARLVSGSATPDLVTVARVRGGLAEGARLVERRVGHSPQVEVVDMREELARGNRSIFSSSLATALSDLRPGDRQAILLINRRGAATFVLCRDCGVSLRCPDCDLPFVFHSDGGSLRCHHCGRSAVPPERCPRCDSGRIRYFGAGTQRVEAELRGRFPALRVGRLDSDAVAARRGFETVYDDFREVRIDVLVGTQ
ncbi:MAG: replication restart helicase PriA, partial [Candidatus Limnocylindria bacterium]